MRSAEAAKSTAELIEASVEKAENGVELNASVQESLESLARNTQRSNAVMAEIAAASEQQSQGVEEINSAVEQMNTVTQETAASSEEGASTAEELSAQAEQLRVLVAAFRLSTGGSRPGRTVMPGKAGQGANARVTGRRAHAETVATPGKAGAGEAASRNRLGALAKTREAEALIPFDDGVLTEF
jgi:methyl-accepting chemotaxis protein